MLLLMLDVVQFGLPVGQAQRLQRALPRLAVDAVHQVRFRRQQPLDPLVDAAGDAFLPVLFFGDGQGHERWLLLGNESVVVKGRRVRDSSDGLRGHGLAAATHGTNRVRMPGPDPSPATAAARRRFGIEVHVHRVGDAEAAVADFGQGFAGGHGHGGVEFTLGHVVPSRIGEQSGHRNEIRPPGHERPGGLT